MKATFSHIPVPESLELLVTHYCLAFRTARAQLAKVRALGAPLIQALENAPGRRLVLDGLEVRLVKRQTIRTRPAETRQAGEPELVAALRGYLVARSRWQAAQFTVEALRPEVVRRLGLTRASPARVVEGWELRLVGRRVVRCRVVDVVQHGRFFRQPRK